MVNHGFRKLTVLLENPTRLLPELARFTKVVAVNRVVFVWLEKVVQIKASIADPYQKTWFYLDTMCHQKVLRMVVDDCLYSRASLVVCQLSGGPKSRFKRGGGKRSTFKKVPGSGRRGFSVFESRTRQRWP